MVMSVTSKLPSPVRLLYLFMFSFLWKFYLRQKALKNQFLLSIVQSEQQTKPKQAKTLLLTQTGELVHYTELINILPTP